MFLAIFYFLFSNLGQIYFLNFVLSPFNIQQSLFCVLWYEKILFADLGPNSPLFTVLIWKLHLYNSCTWTCSVNLKKIQKHSKLIVITVAAHMQLKQTSCSIPVHNYKEDYQIIGLPGPKQCGSLYWIWMWWSYLLSATMKWYCDLHTSLGL